MREDDLCQFLDWDSGFFGRKIARVTVNQLDEEDMEHVLYWCRSVKIDCLYFLADAEDSNTTRLAEDNGFHLVDLRITLENRLAGGSTRANDIAKGSIRLFTPEDVSALRAIARIGHRDSRFYHDTNFPESLCSALYETWIEKSCQGYADAVLVAEDQNQPLGYATCHLRDRDEGQIGLVSVDGKMRCNSIGRELVSASLQWFQERGVNRVIVVTQGRNCRAQRLYQQCGFLTREVQLWYHRWFTSSRDDIGQ